jgi:hypothetical protein
MHSSRELRSSSFEIRLEDRQVRLKELFEGFIRRPRGDHARLDVFPRRKELVVPDDAETILEAINDRAITRLVVEDGGRGAAEAEPTKLASARARIRTCLAYSPSERVAGGDVRIESNPVTEGYVEAILDPESRMAKLREGSDGDRARAETIAARAGEVEPEQAHRLLESRQELMEDRPPGRDLSPDRARGGARVAGSGIPGVRLTLAPRN